MDCYISFIYDGILNTDRVQKMTIINGTNEEAGKYIKKNITEFYDYLYTIAFNVKDTSNDQLNELELAVKKAFKKHEYRTRRKAERDAIISELKHCLDEVSDDEVIPNFNSCNREIMRDPNDQSPYKLIETHKFNKTIGTGSISYHLPNRFGL